jgi:hypothetical protein
MSEASGPRRPEPMTPLALLRYSIVRSVSGEKIGGELGCGAGAETSASAAPAQPFG